VVEQAVQSERAPRDALWDLANGHFVAQAIHVAARLGIADLLREGPLAVNELATKTGSHAPTLKRLLRALASVGIFVEEADGRFSLTPPAEYLRSNVRGSMRNWAMAFAGPAWWSSWGELLHSVQTGEPAFPKALGLPFWEYLKTHPEDQALFNATMSAGDPTPVVQAYDWSPFRLVVDVGGGQGRLLAAILSANPSLRGILFDQPAVVATARAILGEAGVADRCEVVGGDFFTSVPPGADAYVLKVIIHDWQDELATAILRNCRSAMPDTAKLLLLERVLGPPNERDRGKLMDLLMLVGPEGLERTEADYQRILAAAGLRFQRVIHTGGPQSIIEAIPGN
jgi:hypothetical protein